MCKNINKTSIVISIILLSGCMSLFNSQCNSTTSWIDAVQFNGITYLATTTSVGRPVVDTDLGQQFDIVKFKVSGNICTSTYRFKDGDAGYLDPGTPVYHVSGFRPEFRLAAKRDNSVIIFEVTENPYAQLGSDVLDLYNKVSYIGINSAQDGTTEISAIKETQKIESLVKMILQAPLGQSSEPFDDRVYWIAFHFKDGTATAHGYNFGSNQLNPNIILPEDFRNEINQYLPRSN